MPTHLYFHAGTQDYLKQVDRGVWLQGLCDEACDPPTFYPEWFDRLAMTILRDSWGMDVTDINSANCKQIYIHLINYIDI